MSDLRLLLDLGDESWIFEKMSLPICAVLQLREALKDLCTEKSNEEKKYTENSNEDDSKHLKELSKTEVLKLQKTSMDAQYANLQLNTFTTCLSAKVKETKWHGGGALRLSSGTTSEDAQSNNLLVNIIISNKDINYGRHVIQGHGVLTLDKRRAKAFIGNKLSHSRKPSAYKGKENKQSNNTITRASGKVKVVSHINEEGEPSNKKVALENDVQCTDNLTNTCTSEPEENEKESHSDQGENEKEHEQCEYLKRIEERREQNQQAMWDIGLITKSEATIVALFHLRMKKLQDVPMKVLKEACKQNSISFPKQSKKPFLVEILGETLFKSKTVVRKNNKEVFSFSNLK